jgi:hypothetical protein
VNVLNCVECVREISGDEGADSGLLAGVSAGWLAMAAPAGCSVNRMVPREVELIGVPTNSSGTVDGVARASAVLREQGLSAALAGRPGFTDAGDRRCLPRSPGAARPACSRRTP